ncbi:MAG: hypothetical protein H0A76_09490 [Candidatus Thiodubiliella endoseptemdiera]|uniref:Uncharacterized protein n=1 Tax=Candidatus Thiodubiliella endoseptemdiera TaxID=2738886 RepID=A0A853F2D3_9GAMM|nr:hypothetical protein [Candidatus Thiodubiliella endoseptemdiera]
MLIIPIYAKVSLDIDASEVIELRIDAADYQAKIIDYCITQNIEFAIRTKMCRSLKEIIIDKDNKWQPLLDKQGGSIDGQATFKMQHFIGDNGAVFDLVVQRTG